MTKWVKLLNRECSIAFQASVPLVNRDYLPQVIGCRLNHFWCDSLTYGIYYQETELKHLAKAIQTKIDQDPDFPQTNSQDCYRLGKHLLVCSTPDIRVRLTSCTHRQLLTYLVRFRQAYLNFLPYLVYPHAIERHFLNTLAVSLKTHLNTINQVVDYPRYFNLFTTPAEHDIDEHLDLLKTARLLQQQGWSQAVTQSIRRLHRRYCWRTLWSVSAKPLTYDYFTHSVTAFAQSSESIPQAIASLKASQQAGAKGLAAGLDHIDAPAALRAQVDLLQKYIHLRTYRKNVISQAHYLHLPLVRAIGRRMGIGQDIFLVTYEEMLTFLKHGRTVPASTILQRRTAWGVLAVDGHLTVVSGKPAVEATAKRYEIADIRPTTSVNSVHGRPACLGKATGQAVIVKHIREFEKIRQGDILITPMTTPDFVPILNKVVAIVTDEGGVTCHAAIVSREFNLPCLVGTHHATQVFKDGDRVEVDATAGIAKVI